MLTLVVCSFLPPNEVDTRYMIISMQVCSTTAEYVKTVYATVNLPKFHNFSGFIPHLLSLGPESVLIVIH